MNQNNSKSDNGFSSFAIGLSVGVIAALLLGTDEGRKVAKEILASLPEKYKTAPENLLHRLEEHQAPQTPPTPIIEPEETPHHATYDFHDPLEAPPPPPPAVHITRPK